MEKHQAWHFHMHFIRLCCAQLFKKVYGRLRNDGGKRDINYRKSAEVKSQSNIHYKSVIQNKKILTNANISHPRLYCLLCYFILIVDMEWIYKKEKKKEETSSKDYFS
jgi:hypothetical protein